MKSISILTLILGLAISLSQAEARTSVEFPLKGYTFINHKEVKIDVAKLNRTLKYAGSEGLPELVIVGKYPEPFWKVLTKRIEAANKISKTELRFVIESGYYYEYPEICYRGMAAEAVEILDAMLGNFLNEEQGVLAVRYGKTKIVKSDFFKTEKALREAYEENDSREVAEYLDFDGKNGDILVMSDLGPQGDGTELYATRIKVCK